jgi:hypothetical protein
MTSRARTNARWAFATPDKFRTLLDAELMQINLANGTLANIGPRGFGKYLAV